MSDTNHDNIPSSTYLTLLKQQLAQVTNSWTIDQYNDFITFYSGLLPSLMDVERCTVFIMEMGSQKICSIFGTGLEQQQIEPPLEGSIVGDVMKSMNSRLENNLKKYPGYHSYIDEQTGFISRNMICAPIKSITGNSVTGAIQLLNKNEGLFSDQDLRQLEEIAHFLSISIESIVLNQEILRIADSLGKEAERLDHYGIGDVKLIAESPAMREVLDLARIVSKTPVNVLIQGENGTGKELIARLIHQSGNRQQQPFIPVNCASIPENLLESEFFGHEKGAFTSAESSRKGLFEQATGGTLFLDEIAEMPLLLQPKILRAVQEEEGTRLGGNAMLKYDLRLISATNRDLSEEVKKGNFREDLYFRLFSVEIILPPLRERKEDILPLALHFLETTNRKFGKKVQGFSPELLSILESYPWPGNVRQLLKEIERLVALTNNGENIQTNRLSRELMGYYQTHKNDFREEQIDDLTIPTQTRKLEISLIQKAMHLSNSNKTKAAKILGITRQGLIKKVKRYGLSF